MKHTNNTQTVPFLAVTCACAFNTKINLLSALAKVVLDLLAILLSQSNSILLLYNQGFHILEKMRQLHYLALNFLNCVMAVLDAAESLARLAAAIALEECLAEDLPVRGILDSFADLGVRRIGVDNLVLTLYLGLELRAEVALDVLVLIDGSLKPAVDLAKLQRVLRAAGLRLLLERLDASSEAAVHNHCLRAHRVDGALLAGVGVSEGVLLELADSI